MILENRAISPIDRMRTVFFLYRGFKEIKNSFRNKDTLKNIFSYDIIGKGYYSLSYFAHNNKDRWEFILSGYFLGYLFDISHSIDIYNSYDIPEDIPQFKLSRYNDFRKVNKEFYGFKGIRKGYMHIHI